MHEHDGSIAREHQIGTPRQVLAVETKPESKAVREAAYYHLRDRIPAPNAGHYLAALRSVYDIQVPVARSDRVLPRRDGCPLWKMDTQKTLTQLAENAAETMRKPGN